MLVTVVTASVMSIRSWWLAAPTAPKPQDFQLRLMCVLATIMLILTVAIMADAIRKWREILSRPPRGEAPPMEKTRALAGEAVGK